MSDRRNVAPFPNEPPDITKYAIKLGLDPTTAVFSEVFSFEEELTAFVPHPVYSFIFLFPVGPSDGPLELRHQDVVPLPTPVPWFAKQFVGDGCGTLAVIHSVLNNITSIRVQPDSWFATFAARAASLSVDERSQLIYDEDFLYTTHDESAEESTVPVQEDQCDMHFVTFVEIGGNLWELDGRKPQPICHGAVQDLLLGGMGVVKRDYLPHLEGEMRISMCALTVPPQD
jgi:ubiquitin carboxyl-terminal hydrolase L3